MKQSVLSLAFGLAAVASSAPAFTISPLSGDTAAQAPLGPEATSRFATEALDEQVLAALSIGTAGLLVTQGDTVTLQYLGTSAARDATLSFGGSELFQTRSGCSFATALADEFCIIDSIGRSRVIDGLQPGSTFSLDLLAEAQALGPLPQQRSAAQTFGSIADARLLSLANGQILLGFEEGGDASYNDMVLLLSGVSVAAVPEPRTATLLALGALALAYRAGRRRG